MAKAARSSATKQSRREGAASRSAKPDVDSALAALKKLASKSTRDGMARYGIPSDNALGVAVGDIQKLGKQLGNDHVLAEGLWKTGVYEARMLAAFVGDADQLTPAAMDRWRRDFDSWAICDTVCFKLFDRSPHAYGCVTRWAPLKDEFGRRAAFALLACLALHDKRSGDEPFADFLPLVERGASDERNFVKKGVSWALRAIGHRSAALRAASIALAKKLAASSQPAERWVGKDALRDLQRPAKKRG